MKMRIDYVTNSSSSSFLFDKNLDLKKFKNQLKSEIKLLESIGNNPGLIRSLYRIETGLITVDTMLDEGNYSNFDLFELFGWWSKSTECDVIEQYLGFSDHDNREEKLANKQMLIDFIYCNAYPEIEFYLDEAESRGENSELISDKLLKMVEDLDSDKFSTVKEYITYIFKRDTGAEYIQYDGLEAYSESVDIIKKYTDSLIKFCTHMG